MTKFTTRLADAQAAAAALRNGEAAAEPAPASRLRVRRMADVTAERVTWLWPHRFPNGKLSIVAGVQGLGKSFLTVDMAGVITRGDCWPDCPDEPAQRGSVVMLALEDGLADTLRPRLDAAGADVSKVHVVEGVAEVDKSGERVFNVGRDLHLLSELVERIGDVRAVFMDPLNAYIGADVDSHRDNEVRAALHPLAAFAERHRLAVLGVMHLSKAPQNRALFRVLGSVAYTALARAVWFIGEDRDGEPDDRLMLAGKLNLAKVAPGLRFRIEDGRVVWLPSDDVRCSADEAFGDGGGRDGMAPGGAGGRRTAVN
jgi:hypothetical protein